MSGENDQQKAGSKSRPWNVLIFPAGTEIGLEIYNSLRNCKEARIFAAGQDVSNHAQFLFSDYYILPSIYEEECISELSKLVDRLGIDYIFPAYDDVIVELAKQRRKVNAKVIAPTIEISELTRSKSKTYAVLQDCIPVPRIFSSADEVHAFPVLIKPDRGQGSFGVVRVDDREQLSHALAHTKDAIICEYLPGEEYTVDCFSDRDAGLLFSGARLRKRMRNGISVNTETVDLDEAKHYAREISNALGLSGAWFFQIKRSETGELKLLEVGPRVAGSMAAHRVSGLNFPLLTLYEEERFPLSVLLNKSPIALDRALKNQYKHKFKYATLYVDLDDTLVLNDVVNLDVVKLVYKSLNEGKRVVLLTRHKFDLDDTLKKYRLNGLFDEIIHISNGDSKASYIKDKESIFIDDSFAERKDVFEKLGIPTFDSSMIEVIIEGIYDPGL